MVIQRTLQGEQPEFWQQESWQVGRRQQWLRQLFSYLTEINKYRESLNMEDVNMDDEDAANIRLRQSMEQVRLTPRSTVEGGSQTTPRC